LTSRTTAHSFNDYGTHAFNAIAQHSRLVVDP